MAKTGNEYADMLLMHFYRWMHSPSSMLHDPALHRVVHELGQQLFRNLIKELEVLGASVVFASTKSIIIDTEKTTVDQATGYVSYILETIKGNELYDFVDIVVDKSWESLLWMDKHNFGGVQLEDAAAGCTPQVHIASHWNIAEYLPKATQEDFLILVSEFIYVPLKSEQE